MTDTNVIKLAQPGTFTDSLTEILRNGARALLTQAVETEVADFLGRYANLKTRGGPPARRVTGICPSADRDRIGAVAVRRRTCATGRLAEGSGSVQPERFAALRPAHEEPRGADPDPLLEGVSTGDSRRRSARCSAGTGGLSASTIARLKEAGSTNTPAGMIATCPPAVRLRLGRWHLRPGPAEAGCAVPAGDHRRHR